jgi:hypothetical protein
VLGSLSTARGHAGLLRRRVGWFLLRAYCPGLQLVQVTAEDSGDPSRRQPLASHRSVEGKPVEQRVEPFDFERAFSTRRQAEDLDRAHAGRAQLVVDLGVPHQELGIDQRPSGEGQPDLVLGTTLVVQRQQLGQQLLDRAARIVGELERIDALADPLGCKLDREPEQLRLRPEVVPQRPGRPTSFLGDGSHRGAIDALAADDPPDRLRELASPLLVVHDLRHSFFVAHVC